MALFGRGACRLARGRRAFGEERRQRRGLGPSGPVAVGAASASGVRSGSGSQSVPCSRRSASLAMSPFFRCSMRRAVLLALGLAHGFQDLGLGDAAQIVVRRGRPSRRRHVERQRGREACRRAGAPRAAADAARAPH